MVSPSSASPPQLHLLLTIALVAGGGFVAGAGSNPDGFGEFGTGFVAGDAQSAPPPTLGALPAATAAAVREMGRDVAAVQESLAGVRVLAPLRWLPPRNGEPDEAWPRLAGCSECGSARRERTGRGVLLVLPPTLAAVFITDGSRLHPNAVAGSRAPPFHSAGLHASSFHAAAYHSAIAFHPVRVASPCTHLRRASPLPNLISEYGSAGGRRSIRLLDAFCALAVIDRSLRRPLLQHARCFCNAGKSHPPTSVESLLLETNWSFQKDTTIGCITGVWSGHRC